MKKSNTTTAKTASKSQQCYELKCQGLSWKQIENTIGVLAKVGPTLAKGYMQSHNLPHWGAPVAIAAEPGPGFVEIDPTLEVRRGLAYFAEQARNCGDLEKESAFVKALAYLV